MANQILGEQVDEIVEEQSLIPENKNKQLNINDTKAKVTKSLKISGIILAILLFLAVMIIAIFSIINNKDNKIKKGVTIEEIDVSELTKEEAKVKIQEELLDTLDSAINFQYGENIYTLALEQLNVEYKLDEAIDQAYNLGRTGSFIERDLKVLDLRKNTENIVIDVTYDQVTLDACILDISNKLPEQVEQPSYYIEDGELIITSGKTGKAAESEATSQIVYDALYNKNYNGEYYDIPTYDKYPEKIDVEKIHEEIYKETKDAYFTTEPRMVYADETGVDFEQSVEEVKAQIQSEEKEEYTVALKYTPANITVDDLGMDAFPDLLSSYSTTYLGSYNRQTNMRIAAEKVNGTVLMPGETFSYNSTVGERTIAAGFREATIFSDGQAMDGLGGGICQVSTTIYNAALFANLDIVERTNHMFLSTYFTGGRDATVAWGSIDFKFKNNRDYPIKIVSYMTGSGVRVEIYGLKTDNDYEVEIFSNYIGYGTYKTYKRLKKDGQTISTELISTDTYNGSH